MGVKNTFEHLKLNRLKEILVREGVSQKQLAQVLEKNEHTISNWCTNKSQPHLRELHTIADYLEIDIFELLVSNKNEN